MKHFENEQGFFSRTPQLAWLPVEWKKNQTCWFNKWKKMFHPSFNLSLGTIIHLHETERIEKSLVVTEFNSTINLSLATDKGSDSIQQLTLLPSNRLFFKNTSWSEVQSQSTSPGYNPWIIVIRSMSWPTDKKPLIAC